MLVGAPGFSPDLDRFMEMQGAGFMGDSKRNRHNLRIAVHQIAVPQLPRLVTTGKFRVVITKVAPLDGQARLAASRSMGALMRSLETFRE
jgi:hypothetical protein